MKYLSTIAHYLVVFIILLSIGGLLANSGTSKNSEINTIYVPYQANSVYYPYPLAKDRRGRKVMVPIEMDVIPSLHLDKKTKSIQAPAVNFFDGAYPVYYTAGHANGHFNGKISVLNK